MWLSGFEEHPHGSGEICVIEVFRTKRERARSAEMGVGVKKLRNPRLVQDFVTPRLAIDVSEFHTYDVEWDRQTAAFYVDGLPLHSCAEPPTYPLQAMLAVFDFPNWSTGDDDHLEPSFDIDWIEGSSLPTASRR